MGVAAGGDPSAAGPPVADARAWDVGLARVDSLLAVGDLAEFAGFLGAFDVGAVVKPWKLIGSPSASNSVST